ncbi:MAG: SDR family NAD(P)-dependent oxidoreductase, partial [Gammaproteobacteria bacterium]|nr:SDR family NAD(P)-dependent oxidoreductase [Gammaproteobacteria bacterium]
MGDPLRLYGLNALVLNAGSGIGEASARTLAKHGATVVAADTINSGVERHFKSVKGITGMVGNLRDADKIPALVQEVVDQVDGLDIVVNDFPLAFDMPMSAAAKQLDSL